MVHFLGFAGLGISDRKQGVLFHLFQRLFPSEIHPLLGPGALMFTGHFVAQMASFHEIQTWGTRVIKCPVDQGLWALPPMLTL